MASHSARPTATCWATSKGRGNSPFAAQTRVRRPHPRSNQLLDAHSDEFAFQLGGARNFGAGIADAWVINPLYTDREIRRVFDRAKDSTKAMTEKDEQWTEAYRDQFVGALHARLAARDPAAEPTAVPTGGEME